MDDEIMPEISGATEAFNVDTAAATLFKTMNPEPVRGEGGRFAKAEPVGDDAPNPEPSKVVDLKTKMPVKAEEPAPAEEEDEYFELPPEKEGEEPRRIKVDEVWQAYEELPKLKAELEQVKTQAPPPEEYLEALNDTIAKRSEYMKGLHTIAQMINPVDPSIDLLNPASDKYDADSYYRMKTRADQDRAHIAQLQRQWNAAKEEQDAQRKMVDDARNLREANALKKAWPEFFSDRGVSERSLSVLRDYGFKDDEIKNMSDHRQLLLLRDAMELRALKAEKAKAVQVVRQKPKLVKGGARTTTDSKAARTASAMDRLRSSGSMDAAAEALKGLL